MPLMRGVEGAFSIVRAAKNGFLTVSDNRGRIVGEVRSDFRCVCDLAARRAGGTRMDLVSGLGQLVCLGGRRLAGRRRGQGRIARAFQACDA